MGDQVLNRLTTDRDYEWRDPYDRRSDVPPSREEVGRRGVPPSSREFHERRPRRESRGGRQAPPEQETPAPFPGSVLFRWQDVQEGSLFELLEPRWWQFQDERGLDPESIRKQRAQKRLVSFMEKTRAFSTVGLTKEQIISDFHELDEFLADLESHLGRTWSPRHGPRKLIGDLREVLYTTTEVLRNKEGVTQTVQELLRELYLSSRELVEGGMQQAQQIQGARGMYDTRMQQKARSVGQRLMSVMRTLGTSAEGRDIGLSIASLIRILMYQLGEKAEGVIKAGTERMQQQASQPYYRSSTGPSLSGMTPLQQQQPLSSRIAQAVGLSGTQQSQGGVSSQLGLQGQQGLGQEREFGASHLHGGQECKECRLGLHARDHPHMHHAAHSHHAMAGQADQECPECRALGIHGRDHVHAPGHTHNHPHGISSQIGQQQPSSFMQQGQPEPPFSRPATVQMPGRSILEPGRDRTDSGSSGEMISGGPSTGTSPTQQLQGTSDRVEIPVQRRQGISPAQQQRGGLFSGSTGQDSKRQEFPSSSGFTGTAAGLATGAGLLSQSSSQLGQQRDVPIQSQSQAQQGFGTQPQQGISSGLGLSSQQQQPLQQPLYSGTSSGLGLSSTGLAQQQQQQGFAGTSPMRQQEIQSQLDQMIDLFRNIFSKTAQNFELRQAVLDLQDIISHYYYQYAVSGVGARPGVQMHASRVAELFDVLLKQLAPSGSIERIKAVFTRLTQAIQQDPRIQDFFNKLNKFMQDNINNPEAYNREEFKLRVQDLYEHGRYVFSESSQQVRDSMNSVGSEINRFSDDIKRDRVLSDWAESMRYLLSDMGYYTASGYWLPNTELFYETMQAVTPYLAETFSLTALPPCRYMDKSNSILLDEMVLYTPELPPRGLEAHVEEFFAVSLRDLRHGRMSGSTTLSLRDLKIILPKVRFAIRRKAFPGFKDEGHMDVFIRGVHIALTSRNLNTQPFLRSPRARCVVDDIQIKFLNDCSHTTLLNWALGSAKGPLKTGIQKAVESTLEYYTQCIFDRLNNMFAMWGWAPYTRPQAAEMYPEKERQHETVSTFFPDTAYEYVSRPGFAGFTHPQELQRQWGYGPQQQGQYQAQYPYQQPQSQPQPQQQYGVTDRARQYAPDMVSGRQPRTHRLSEQPDHISMMQRSYSTPSAGRDFYAPQLQQQPPSAEQDRSWFGTSRGRREREPEAMRDQRDRERERGQDRYPEQKEFEQPLWTHRPEREHGPMQQYQQQPAETSRQQQGGGGLGGIFSGWFGRRPSVQSNLPESMQQGLHSQAQNLSQLPQNLPQNLQPPGQGIMSQFQYPRGPDQQYSWQDSWSAEKQRLTDQYRPSSHRFRDESGYGPSQSRM